MPLASLAICFGCSLCGMGYQFVFFLAPNRDGICYESMRACWDDFHASTGCSAAAIAEFAATSG